MVPLEPSVEAAEALKTWKAAWESALQIAQNIAEDSEEVHNAWEQIRLPLGVAKEAAEAAIKAAMKNALDVGWESAYWCRDGNEEKAWEEAKADLGL